MTTTPCTASRSCPTPSSPDQAHTCMSLAVHGSSAHRCECGTRWTTTAHQEYDQRVHEAEVDELDDEAVTVTSVLEWLVDAASTLDGLIDDLHTLKRQVSDDDREALMVAANAVGLAWAHARTAITSLSDVTEPTAGTGSYL